MTCRAAAHLIGDVMKAYSFHCLKVALKANRQSCSWYCTQRHAVILSSDQ